MMQRSAARANAVSSLRSAGRAPPETLRCSLRRPPRQPQEIDMLGITPFGAIHTLISLVALAAGLAALFRYRTITPGNLLGNVYIVGTVATCVTGFFIFHHGGFGKPHALGIVTLIVLGIAGVAG